VIPGARTKNGVQHTIPLAPLTRAILDRLPRFLGSDYVFTAKGKTSISGSAGRAKLLLDAAITAPIAPWTIHDLRRTVASGMARLGVQLPVVEKILNHTSGSFAGVAGIYQRHDFADEKRQALECWAQHLLSIDGSAVALRA
jgi:integrase